MKRFYAILFVFLVPMLSFAQEELEEVMLDEPELEFEETSDIELVDEVAENLSEADSEVDDVLEGDGDIELVQPVKGSSSTRRTASVTKTTRTTTRSVTHSKDRNRLYVTGFFGPHWSSVYHNNTEFGKVSYLSFGVDVGFKLTKRLFLDGYFYYLPSEVQSTQKVTLQGINVGETHGYENNIYGLRAGYTFLGGRKYRLSAITGVVSHIFGGIEDLGNNQIEFDKFEHTGITLGVRYERRITSNWVFDSDLAYILPLSVSEVEKASGSIWYRGILGAKRRMGKKWRMALEYQAVYHESEFEFKSGAKANPEFFLQTVMLGVKYNF